MALYQEVYAREICVACQLVPGSVETTGEHDIIEHGTKKKKKYENTEVSILRSNLRGPYFNKRTFITV